MHDGSLVPRSILIYDQETGEQAGGSHIWVHIENRYKTSLKSGIYRLRIEREEGGTPLNIKNEVVKAGRETLINIE